MVMKGAGSGSGVWWTLGEGHWKWRRGVLGMEMEDAGKWKWRTLGMEVDDVGNGRGGCWAWSSCFGTQRPKRPGGMREALRINGLRGVEVQTLK